MNDAERDQRIWKLGCALRAQAGIMEGMAHLAMLQTRLLEMTMRWPHVFAPPAYDFSSYHTRIIPPEELVERELANALKELRDADKWLAKAGASGSEAP